MSPQILSYITGYMYGFRIHAIRSPHAVFYMLYCPHVRTRYVRLMEPVCITLAACAGDADQINDIVMPPRPESPVRIFYNFTFSVKDVDSVPEFFPGGIEKIKLE